MISRPLMTADELKRLPKFKWIVEHGSDYPFIAQMPYWSKWGIRYDKPFKMPKSEPRSIHYGSCKSLKTAITAKYRVDFVDPREIDDEDDRAASLEMAEDSFPGVDQYFG